MPWSSYQAQRLAWEETVLERELPQFAFVNRNTADKTYVTGWECSPDNIHSYQFVLIIPLRYPDQMPALYVTSPYRLFCRDGTLLPACSHEFHTRQSSPLEGHTQICHSNESEWDPSMSCLRALFRGIIWTHCYEQHLRTGRTINQHYEEIKARLA